MNYYEEIKNEIINNEVAKKVKDYSKNRNDLRTYYNIGKLLSKADKQYGKGIIKEYYPNAILNKFTIYDKDNYGRYIVGINFTKSSTSESSTYNWCCVWVKDINDSNKIGYWKTNPMGVSYIYNDSSYGWGAPLPNNL